MVDLPAPFSPTRAWISPFLISIVPSARATTGPKVLTAPCRASAKAESFSAPGTWAFTTVRTSTWVSSWNVPIPRPLHEEI